MSSLAFRAVIDQTFSVSRVVLMYAFILCACLTTSQSMAKQSADALFSWRSQVPDPLIAIKSTPKSLAALCAEGTLFYPQPKKQVSVALGDSQKSFNASFVSGAVVLNAPVSKVKSLLTNYASYPKYFPKLVSAEVTNSKEALARVKYRAVIDMPVPVLKFDETFVLRHQVVGNSLSTWIEDSPLKYGMGEFRWYDAGGGKTLLTLTHWGDFHHKNIRGVVLPVIFKAMPELKVAVPNGVSGYVLETLRLKFNGKDVPKSYVQSNITPNWEVPKAGLKTLQNMLKLTDELPVMYAHPPRKLTEPVAKTNAQVNPTLRFVTSIQYMPASQDTVQSWLYNPKKYVELLKQVKSVETTKQGNGIIADTKIGVGLGVINIPFRSKVYFEKTTKNVAEFRAAGGDVRWIYGRYTSRASKANKSLFMSTLATKTDKDAPFLLRIAHALPYHDYLGNMGAAPLLSYKVRQKLQEKPQ